MNTDDARNQTCGSCGALLSPHDLDGLCTRCVVRCSILTDDAEQRAGSPDGNQPASPLSGSSPRFGDYELLDEIARGGMGVVYRARQVSLDRVVAVKMLLLGQFAAPGVFQRFRAEAESAAKLQHPHIVAIHDIGEQDGQPFFSMDYVAGRNLADLVRDRPLPARAAAQYLVKITHAVQFAHDHGILHRDLKPANILIDEADEPRITDFGLAKRLSSDSSLTLSGQVLGSPNFLPPEQAGGHAQAIGPACDIYGLGAVLYYLLTARPPFVAETFESTLFQVLNSDPVPPRQLNPSVPLDLETICLKCLEKETGRRYESAKELAEELDRFRRDEPIHARPIGPVARSWRWCRRKPALAAALAAVVTLLLTVTGVSVTAAWRIATARKAEQREAYYATIGLADQYTQRGDISRAKELLFGCPPELRHWEWGHLIFRCYQETLSIAAHAEIEVDQRSQSGALVDLMQGLRWDPSGSRLATLGRDGSLRIWDPNDGRRLFDLGDTNHPVTALAFHPTNAQLAVAFKDGTVELWDPATGKAQTVLRSDAGKILQLAWHPGGQWLAAASQREFRVWDTTSGEVVSRAQLPADIRSVTFTPDERRLLVQASSEARLYDPAGREELSVIRAPAEPGTLLFVDPPGKRWVTINSAGEVILWQDAEHSLRLGAIQGSQPDILRRVFFNPDGSRICTGGSDGTARVWETATGREILSLPSRVTQAVFSPDGQVLAVGGNETTAELWDLEGRRKLLTLRGHSELVSRIVFRPDGRRVATAGRDGTVKLWSASPGREVLPERGYIWGTIPSPDGQRIATAPFGSREFSIWDTLSGQRLVTVDTIVQDVIDSAFSPDGRRLVTVGMDNLGRVWDAQTGQPLLTLKGHTRLVWTVAYSPGGEAIATAGKDGTARVWDAITGRELHCFSHGTGWVYYVRFSPEGRQLASAGEDGLALWDLSSGQRLLRVPSEGRTLRNAVFGPGKDQLTLAYNGETAVRICDARTGQMVDSFKLGGQPGDYSFSPDAQRFVVAACRESAPGNDTRTPAAELWAVRPGRRILSLEGHTEPVLAAWFAGTGQRVVTRSFDNTVRQWESFPWQPSAYPGSPKELTPDRVQQYARTYWQTRLAAEESPAPLLRNRPPRESLWPARESTAAPEQIDLSTHYTALLDSFLTPCYEIIAPDNDLSELARGLLELGGVRFDIRGVIFLRKGGVDQMAGPGKLMWEAYPAQTGDIAVNRPIRQLHVLHGVAFAEFWRRCGPGECVGRWIWRYEDGTEKVTEVLYGKDVQNWWFKPGEEATKGPAACQVVWTGANPFAQSNGYSLQLSLRTWDNPRPDAVVRSLSYASGLTEAAPFVVAITVE